MSKKFSVIKHISSRYKITKDSQLWVVPLAVFVAFCMLFFTGKTIYRFYALPHAANAAQVTAATDAMNVLAVGTFVLIAALFFIINLIFVNRRLKENMQQRFAEAKNVAEDAKHSKTQFLTTMTNELRAPLNRILSNTSALLQSHLQEPQKTQANQIHLNGITLLSIVNDSLDFFKIESGKLEIRNNPFVLHLCIEEVLQILTSDSREMDLNYELNDRIPNYVVGDMARIRQVLMNLIGNAMQINDTGKLILFADLLSKEGNEMVLQFKIADMGDKKPASSPSAETAQSLSYVSHYTGLGLSVAARLVALMGGAIKVESTSSTGTVFTFTIKVQKAIESNHTETIMNNNPNQTTEKIDRDLFKKYPLRILAADDNEISQIVLSSMLLKMGYNCEVAQNGSEAVSKAIDGKYDLIFMDIFMPEMDGLEATRRIREYYLQNTKPIIIALTSNALEEKETFLQAGINDFVTKPFKPNDLQQIIIQSCSN